MKFGNLRRNFGQGFLRPEALLHVVLVSDETEQSPDRENWDGSFTPAWYSRHDIAGIWVAFFQE